MSGRSRASPDPHPPEVLECHACEETLMRKLATALLLAVAVGLGLTTPTAAAPGSATLTVSPNPVSLAGEPQPETFTGCGYPPDGGVEIHVFRPDGWIFFFGGPADNSGCVDIVSSAAWVTMAGDYPVVAYRVVQTGQTVKLRKLAETVLTVTD